MKDIIIVCGGDTAVEAYDFINLINDEASKSGKEKVYNILGFIDDTKDTMAKYPHIKEPVLGKISDWNPIGNEWYVLGIAQTRGKEKIVEALKNKGCKFETIIHPRTILMPNTTIGEGCIIAPYSMCSNVTIGNYVTILGSMIGIGTIIDDYSTTLGFTNIAGGKIGKRVYIGSHAVLLGVTAENDAVIGVGSIVVKRVKAGTKVFGNPAVKVDY